MLRFCLFKVFELKQTHLFSLCKLDLDSFNLDILKYILCYLPDPNSALPCFTFQPISTDYLSSLFRQEIRTKYFKPHSSRTLHIVFFMLTVTKLVKTIF